MLPNLKLDNEMFKDIINEAVGMIPELYPEWTDFNEHDPGITILELLAWLKENQQYYIDKIGIANKKKYLKLLGMKQKNKCPARVMVKVTETNDDLILSKGSGLWSEGLDFETIEECFIQRNSLYSIHSLYEKEYFLNTISKKKMFFYIFGEDAEIDEIFCIAFSEPLVYGEDCSIYFEIAEEYEVKRNRICDNNFIPLGEFSLEVLTKAGWIKIDNFCDETYGFIESGRIIFNIPENFPEMEMEREAYRIRFVLNKSYYQMPPAVKNISLNVFPALQKKTIAKYIDTTAELISDAYSEVNIYSTYILEYVSDNFKAEVLVKQGDDWIKSKKTDMRYDGEAGLNEVRFTVIKGINADEIRVLLFDKTFEINRVVGIGNGFPYQRFDMRNKNILGSDFHIMIEGQRGIYSEWNRINDFDEVGANGEYFIFDEEKGILSFGNSEHGKVPKGKILIISYSETQSQDGNIKAGKEIFSSEYPEIRLTNDENGYGGREYESIEQCFMRFNRQREDKTRAVTFQDFEDIVSNTPGLMIKGCRAMNTALADERFNNIKQNTVSIAVELLSPNRDWQLNRACIENIRCYLADKVLIGTKFNIIPPKYIGVSIFCNITIKTHYNNGKKEIEDVIKEYFKSIEGEFGNKIMYNKLYGKIDILECVLTIRSLTITAGGNGVHITNNGDIIIPQDGLAYLEKYSTCISTLDI